MIITALIHVFLQEPVVGSWSEIAIDDLHFMRATLRENHPGPVDTLNPEYRDWYEGGFDQAIELAEQADSYAGYHFAIKYYASGFQDGHLGALGETGALHERLNYQWPNFTIRYDQGAFRVAETADDSALVTGERLLSCDGQAAEDLAANTAGRFYALWSVRGARVFTAPFLMIDAGNPFIERPRICQFEMSGEQVLDWRPISNEDLQRRLDATRALAKQDADLREFADGAYWISLPSFSGGDPDTVEAIQSIADTLNADPERYRKADILVLDVRGNGGGSTTQALKIADALWTRPVLESVYQSSDAVDWRASRGNILFLEHSTLPRQIRNSGEDSSRVQETRDLIAHMREALKAGEPYYRLALDDDSADSGDAAPVNPVEARVYLLTDAHCFSACLDFADIVKFTGQATQIGQETRADAVYIDNRSEWLPSRIGLFGFSMKVYRGRPRGHNEPYIPDHLWEGDISDTDALQEWVIDLSDENPN